MPLVGKKESGLEAAEDGGMIPGIAVNWLSCETIVHQLHSQNKASTKKAARVFFQMVVKKKKSNGLIKRSRVMTTQHKGCVAMQNETKRVERSQKEIEKNHMKAPNGFEEFCLVPLSTQNCAAGFLA